MVARGKQLAIAPRGRRALAALVPWTLALASAAAAGCGGGTDRPAAVASVQGSEIPASVLAHWEGVKRHEANAAGVGAPPARQLQDEALAFLITAAWLEGEAAARGIAVSPSRVEASYEQLANGPGGHTFAEVMSRRGLARADELRLLRLEALARDLRAAIAARAGGASSARTAADLTRFEAAYRARWRRRTACRAAYAIPECGRVEGAAAPAG